jgi:hypothetical protein
MRVWESGDRIPRWGENVLGASRTKRKLPPGLSGGCVITDEENSFDAGG